MIKNIKIPLAGDLLFPRGVVTRREGRVVLPAALDSPANAAVDLVLVSSQTVGAVSFSVSTRVVDPDGIHFAPVLYPDAIEDRSVPQEQRDTFTLSFSGGDLLNVTAGAVLLVEVVRYGGARRVQTEADCELVAAYLRIEVPDGGGSGEANTASNVGAGAGVFKEKVGVDLRFKSIVSASDALLVAGETDEVELDLDPSGIDHGALSGLSNDDHTQYALLDGRDGGQTLKGGTDAAEKLILHSTNHATKGDIDFHSADITHLSTARFRMAGQNRIRYLNSACLVFDTNDQIASTGVLTLLTWNSEHFDTDGIHSTSSNTGRLTAPLSGIWYAYLMMIFGGSATGTRTAVIVKNGTTLDNNQWATVATPKDGNAMRVFIGAVIQLSAGDYIEAYGLQDSGGNLALNVGIGAGPFRTGKFGMAYIGEQ